jgi:uncharacterized GH25 family protein
MLQERRPRRDVFAVIPEQAGIWVFDGIASGDALKSYGAASRAAAGYSSLLVQRRVLNSTPKRNLDSGVVDEPV